MAQPLVKPQRYTADQVVEALTATKGMITLTARKLGCNPQTVRNYVTRYPSVAQAMREAREGFLDMTELALQKAVQNGEGWAIAFTLRTIGRHRGYVERTEVDQSVTVYTVDIDSTDTTNK